MDLVVFAISLVVFGGGAFAVHYTYPPRREARRLARRLREIPQRTIATVVEGELARISGVATPLGAALTTPLAGQPCVYYQVDVEIGSGLRSFREAQGVAFVLDDGTGRAVVELRGARLGLTQDGAHTSGRFDDPTEAERMLLHRHGLTGEGLLGFNRGIVYVERSIGIGERVTVLGRGVREPDPDGASATTADYRGAAPTRLCLTGSVAEPLEISDDVQAVHTHAAAPSPRRR